MKIEQLRKFFQMRLQENLPGAQAHSQMQPMHSGGSSIRFKHREKPRKGGVLILLYEEDGIVKFPLIERPEYDGIHSGQIALPGGKMEDMDSDLIATSLREAEEEIGVGREQVHVIGSMSQFFVGASNYDILPVIGIVENTPLFKPDPREVKEIVTPALSDLLDARRRLVKDIKVRNGYNLTSPYFDLQGKVVWGATAMMLSELAAILGDFDAFGREKIDS